MVSLQKPPQRTKPSHLLKPFSLRCCFRQADSHAQTKTPVMGTPGQEFEGQCWSIMCLPMAAWQSLPMGFWCPPEIPVFPLLLPRPFHHPPHPSPGLDCWPGTAQGAWSWSSTAQSGPSWCPVMASIPQLVSPCGEGCWAFVELLLCQDSEAGSEEPVFPSGRSSKSACCFVLGDGSEGKEEMVIPVGD